MPAESLDEQSTDTNNNDINVIIPISDQERLRWTDGNDGRILGLLYEISLHYVKMGLFQEFFEHGAVATNTTTQIPSASSMSFIMGEVADPVPHDFNNPCPAPAQRVAAALAARAANGEAAFAFPTSLPPNSGFTINVLSAKKEDSKLLRSLCYVFGDAPYSDELIENAAGSGLALLAALRARASAASTADRAIVSATFDRARSDCMKGEITLTSLKSKIKAYKRARRVRMSDSILTACSRDVGGWVNDLSSYASLIESSWMARMLIIWTSDAGSGRTAMSRRARL